MEIFYSRKASLSLFNEKKEVITKKIIKKYLFEFTEKVYENIIVS